MDKKNFFASYDSPRVEVIEMEMEQAVLQGSDVNLDPEDLPW